jgi:hypothetical protein
MARSMKIVVAAAFAALALAAGAASAETRTPYQIQGSANCNAQAFCEAFFPVTPANRRVELDRVNCIVTTTQPLELSALRLSTTPPIVNALPVSQVLDTGASDDHYINEATSLFIPAGFQASVEMGTTAGSNPFQIICSLYGNLVFLP